MSVSDLAQCWAEISVCWGQSIALLLNGFFFFYVPPPPLSSLFGPGNSVCKMAAARDIYMETLNGSKQHLWLWWMLRLWSLLMRCHSYRQTRFIWLWPFSIDSKIQIFCGRNSNYSACIMTVLSFVFCFWLHRAKLAAGRIKRAVIVDLRRYILSDAHLFPPPPPPSLEQTCED